MDTGRTGLNNRRRAEHILLPGESLIDYEFNVDAGSIGRNGGKVEDAYDLLLARVKSTGAYTLIVHMKVQFFFSSGHGRQWSLREKSLFVAHWQAAIQTTWGKRQIFRTIWGTPVHVDFRFTTRIEGWYWDHWEITVTRIPAGSFRQSYVSPGNNTVALDSEDLVFVLKAPGSRQRGVAHEFGHMLGLDDEYNKPGALKLDIRSMMNAGELVRPRHDAELCQWARAKINEHSLR